MDLAQLSNLLVNLGSPHQFLVQNLGEPNVFHYTDLNALQGIVGEHDLWLTNSRFSNDYEEGEHGKKIVASAIANRVGRADLAADEREFARDVGEQLARTDDHGVYVCCFCRKDDLLGQWRSYGSNGTGVSIGLATDEFQWITGPDAPLQFGLIYLWRVFYKEETQLRIVDDCIALASQDPAGDRAARIDLAVDAIRFFVPTFKNPDFEEEQEARLVFRPVSECPVGPSFRVGRGMLVPYFSLQELAKAAGQETWRPPVTSVRIGPSANRDINRQGVELMLGSQGYPNVTVDVSDTPYRG
ncbi:MAG: DUF2971 domain-containing protein [Planctomycetota bacterium]